MTRTVIADSLRGAALTASCLLAVACATTPEMTTAGGAPAVTPTDAVAIRSTASISREKAIASYRDYLRSYPNSPEYDNIARRLADLLVERAADLQLVTTTGPEGDTKLPAEAMQAYSEAISLYEALLNKAPQGAERTALLYQLARAYEESGQSQQALLSIDRLLSQEPDVDMRLYADTRFRQGELLFAEGNYPDAGNAYQAVVDLGTSVPAFEQSVYKLGWSLFKQECYREALPVLFAFLDRKLEHGKAHDTQIRELTPADREQVADLLRVTSRSFAQLGGVDAVQHYFTQNGSRSYEQQVYLALAAWYVEQEQVSAATATWLALAQADPLGAQAPGLMGKAIQLNRQAGFRQRVVELETLYVQRYGRDSEFWTIHPPADFPDVTRLLQSSLQELARLSHAQADKTGDANKVHEAEQWYRRYLASFGAEPATTEMNFQLAELLYDNGQYRQALDEYERTAWSREPHSRTIEAALGAQHASGEALEQANEAQREELTERATAGALRFVKSYPDHPAAPGLLANSGTVLLEQQQYDRALASSDSVLGSAATPTALRQVAWSLRAQTLFAMEDYPAAAKAYSEALQLAQKDDERRPALQAGLATATYQQAGQALAMGDPDSASSLYQEAAALAPDTAMQATATFDAATTLLALESWPEAIALLVRFRDDYPDDPLQGEITQKLAYAYERSGAYNEAASEYQRLGQDRQAPESLQREALLRALELYRKTGATQQAIGAGERYVERFQEPAAVAVEVMQQLADLESGDGDNLRRHYWLEAIVKLDRKIGSAGTLVPAAEASLEMAEQQLVAFRHVQLVAPVQKRLAQKIQAMKQALTAFEAAIDYGVYPVTTAATYHIASIYDELARALLTSERPAGLTSEELAEYDVLLAEQAAPFAQQAIDLYRRNVQRSGSIQRDNWVEKSERQLHALQQNQ
jgi:tetratricopeptide (TPR) repeat protein